MDTDETSKAPEAGSAPAASEPNAAANPAAVREESEEVKTHRARLADVKRILAGSLPIALHLEFLYSHNHADLQVRPLIWVLTLSQVEGFHVSQTFSRIFLRHKHKVSGRPEGASPAAANILAAFGED